MITSVKVVIRNAKGEILLQMRNGTHQPYLWALWGGGVEASDPTPTYAAAREVEEELGLPHNEANFQLLGNVTLGEGKEEAVFTYTPTLEWGGFVVNEGAGAAFFTRTDLNHIPLAPSAQRLLTLNPEIAK